eukprot:NODE_3739_length_1168_cov_376.798086_g3554_i0.p1 GENE.NODE_3739_length_1168_cov_376.798086_g3554_i0~~NODE_3739_length_1168_cov_376.798086_g3554_i0.p1  ORF type:complete len:334 (+),score=94.68 NODE_3739_length_1168_cov_376.798086_g3554_i0:75-1076(+)
MPRSRPAKHVSQARERHFSDKKIEYFGRAGEYFEMYDKMMIVFCDNVQSRQMQNIRIALRGQAHVLMGKNTLLRKILLDRSEKSARDKLIYQKLVAENRLVGNVGLVLTNGDLSWIKDQIDLNKVQAPARQGAVSPLNVSVPAGNTGLEPTKTQFFQALGIQTKITKGTVEILKEEQVLTEGEKVGNSEAALLAMLGIKPFFYGLQIRDIYDNGSVYGAEVLSLTDEDLKAKFTVGLSNVTAFALGAKFPTKASLPYTISNAFKDMLALTLPTDFSMAKGPGAELKEAILSGKCAAAAPVASAGATEAAPAAAKKVEEEEEEGDDDMGFGLFD